MRYAILRLEEEIRIVIDVRRAVQFDDDMTADVAAAFMIETSRQLRDLAAALRVLEPLSMGYGESTLSAQVRHELVAITGFTTTPKEMRK